jgi:hypothetical protein
LTVIVNPANSVSKLTREQLENLYWSNQNWKKLVELMQNSLFKRVIWNIWVFKEGGQEKLLQIFYHPTGNSSGSRSN